MPDNGQHFVAIIGGAIAGSVAAEILAEHGIRVAVIEQNKRPYGKIEDGLPRWHAEQRKQEYARIDSTRGRGYHRCRVCANLLDLDRSDAGKHILNFRDLR